MSTYRRKRTAYHHGNLREALLRAGAEILEEQGIGAITMREVARLAGVTHGAPYRHFAGLEQLLAELAEAGFRELGRALEGRPPVERGEAYVRFGLAHPARFRLMFGGTLRLAQHPRLRQTSAQVYDSLVAALGARGDLAQPENAAAAAWALVHGLTHLLLGGHLEALAERAGREGLIQGVLGAVRFAAAPQRSA
jgi:AcrR family transcriptional regulator